VAFTELLPLAPVNVQDAIFKLLEIKAAQEETYLHPREADNNLLQQTVLYNQEHAQKLGTGKKINAELEAFFREEIKR
jgi:hypothetical protein